MQSHSWSRCCDPDYDPSRSSAGSRRWRPGMHRAGHKWPRFVHCLARQGSFRHPSWSRRRRLRCPRRRCRSCSPAAWPVPRRECCKESTTRERERHACDLLLILYGANPLPYHKETHVWMWTWSRFSCRLTVAAPRCRLGFYSRTFGPQSDAEPSSKYSLNIR